MKNNQKKHSQIIAKYVLLKTFRKNEKKNVLIFFEWQLIVVYLKKYL